MAATIDTLGFAKHLRSAGVPDKQAEAHAEAVRDYLMSEVATKADIVRLESRIERQTLQLTVRLGGIIVAAVGFMVTMQKFF